MDLTFAEQVKIVLGRKNMTIKQLAEEIQEKTGHKMSRQNLTQRLGRDNFQEQDMRLIAEILGCPFQLNILDALEEEDGERLLEIRRKAEAKAQKKEDKIEESGNDVTVGDMIDMMESVAEESAVSTTESGVNVKKLAVNVEKPGANAEESGAAETESGVNVKKLAVNVEKSGADAEESGVAETESGVNVKKSAVNVEESGKSAEGAGVNTAGSGQANGGPEKEKKIPKWEPKPAEKKEDRSGIWNRREEKLRRKKETHPHGDWIGATPQSRSKDFMKDAAPSGEINPYTGKEYETNSVRMHPKRIGYIQVYDRGNHKWTDMTEWAFYGFQEQKKSLLGSDYDEPIYLD